MNIPAGRRAVPPRKRKRGSGKRPPRAAPEPPRTPARTFWVAGTPPDRSQLPKPRRTFFVPPAVSERQERDVDGVSWSREETLLLRLTSPQTVAVLGLRNANEDSFTSKVVWYGKPVTGVAVCDWPGHGRVSAFLPSLVTGAVGYCNGCGSTACDGAAGAERVLREATAGSYDWSKATQHAALRRRAIRAFPVPAGKRLVPGEAKQEWLELDEDDDLPF